MGLTGQIEQSCNPVPIPPVSILFNDLIIWKSTMDNDFESIEKYKLFDPQAKQAIVSMLICLRLYN
jgi:hypothetical protein